MDRSRLRATLTVALLALLLLGTTRVTDPATVFHRLYVIGCGQLPVEVTSFADDANDLKSGLEGEGRQAEGSSSETLERPSFRALIEAIRQLKEKAKPGEEVTFAFIGHGGGGSEKYGVTGGADEPFDEQVWLNCGEGEDAKDHTDDPNDVMIVTDDALANLLRGFRAGVTLVVIMDSCWGGGFTGGSADIQEGDDTTVIGPKGECPIDNQFSPWNGTRLFSYWEDTLPEDIGVGAGGEAPPADADGDGVVTAAELETWLEGRGWELGPPVDTEAPAKPEEPKAGKSKCGAADGTSCDGPSLAPDAPTTAPGGDLRVRGTGFPAGATVTLELGTVDEEVLPLGTVGVAPDGTFTTTVTLDVERGRYLLAARTPDGSRDDVQVAALPVGGTFVDDDGNVHEASVESVALSGITSGCGDDRYCPARSVTRGQLAALLVRALGLPRVATDAFGDDEGSVFEADIDALAASGTTTDCAPERFCPDAPVTRGQLASLLDRALDLGVGDGSDPQFTDDDGSVHEASITRLAASGITAGCRSGRFCPDVSVRRDQMASFLAAAGFLPSFPPPPGIDLDGDGDEERVVGDPTLGSGATISTDLDGDGDTDEVAVGTQGGGEVAGTADTDGDGEGETVVADPTLDPGQTITANPDRDRDRDGRPDDHDPDVVWVGTRGGGRTAGAGDVDGDGDEEVVVEDPTLAPGQTISVNTDRDPDVDTRPDDSDADVIWVGTQGGGTVVGIGDDDGDGDAEITVEDPTLDRGTTLRTDLDGDGDVDLVRVGTREPAPPPSQEEPPPEEEFPENP